MFSSGSLLRNRRAFIQEFFPRWSGFCADSADSKIQPLKALELLECLVKDISVVLTVDSTGKSYTFYLGPELNLSEVGVRSKSLLLIKSFILHVDDKICEIYPSSFKKLATVVQSETNRQPQRKESTKNTVHAETSRTANDYIRSIRGLLSQKTRLLSSLLDQKFC